MPKASDSLLTGQRRLLSEHGEALAFRGSEVRGVVKRGGSPLPHGETDLGSEQADESTIEVPLSEWARLADSSAPSKGESFTDGYSVNWRIVEARSKGPLGWRLTVESRII